MKFNIPKDWVLSRASAEVGQEIGAGSPDCLTRPKTIERTPAEPPSVVEQRISFGLFVALMRRKHRWSVQKLAEKAEVDPGEILLIESDPHRESEPSTVYGLAGAFRLPAKRLFVMAGLAEERSDAIGQAALRFAASAQSSAPLNKDEEVALQTYLKVVLDHVEKK